MAEDKKNITFGKIGNALKSVAKDHITAVAGDVFDEERQKYQNEVTADLETKIAAERERAEAAEQANADLVNAETERALGAEEKIRITMSDTFRIVQHDKYIFGLTDSQGKSLFTIDFNGEIWGKKGMTDEVRETFAQILKEIAILQEITKVLTVKDNNGDNLLMFVDQNEKVLFGYKNSEGFFAPKGMSEDAKKRFKKIEAQIESLSFVENSDYLIAFQSKDGHLLLGLRPDGTINCKDIRELWQRLSGLDNYIRDVEKSLNEQKALFDSLFQVEEVDGWLLLVGDSGRHIAIKMDDEGFVTFTKEISAPNIPLHIIESDNYMEFFTKDGRHLMSVDKNGHTVVNGLKIGTYGAEIQVVDNNTYLVLLLDRGGKRLAAYNNNTGEWELGNVNAKNVNAPGVGKLIDNEIYAQAVMSSDGRVYYGYRNDIGFYCSKGQPEETKKEIKRIDQKLSDFEKAMEEFHGGTGDWSEATYIDLPIPRLAHVNLITSRMPTAKSGMGTAGVTCDIESWLEYFDHEGNYFKKKILLSAQGNSSMAFVKKNLAFDIFNDIETDDTFKIKFGDWVSQDSFHMKAYYTDTFRGRGAVSYMLYEQMVNTRPINDRRPYQQMFVDKTSTGNEGYDCNTKLNENFETGAKCFPMGFPCIVYQNGEFYGVYSFQLKKHRDNMWQNKKTAENVHLDGTLGAASIFGGTIDWTQFEVRNPKSLYYQATALEDFPTTVQNAIKQGRVTYDESKGMYEYNGDYPAEIATKKYNCKQYIEALSKYCGELSALETNLAAQVSASTITQEEMNATMRTEIANRFYVSFMIDYILEVNLVRDGDGWNKNWQWTTWDGVHWTANPYDHDGVFGGFHIGVYQGGAYSSSQGTSKTIPSGWIWAYYLDELKARWAELRKAKVFDATNIAGLLKDWVDRVGYDNWEREFERWPETPCNRDSHVNTAYWKRSGGYFSNNTLDKGTWKTETEYEKNQYASTYEAIQVEKPDGTTKNVNQRTIWQAVITNTGVDPRTDDGTNWKRISWDPNRTYAKNETCYYGCQTLYQMKSQVDNNLGNEPITKFYSEYPYELGSYDSVYRVYAWLQKTIEYIDKTFEYTE